MLHHSRHVIFSEGKQFTALNGAYGGIFQVHLYKDVIEESKPTPTKQESETLQPTSDRKSKRPMEEPLGDDSPLDPPKPMNKTREFAGLEMLLGDGWKLPAEGSHRNHAAKLAEFAQLAFEDEVLKRMNPIYATAAISDDHEDGIDPKLSIAATQPPLADKWDMAMKQELDAMSQHQVFGEFGELLEGGKALPSHWVDKIKRDGTGNVQRFMARLV